MPCPSPSATMDGDLIFHKLSLYLQCHIIADIKYSLIHLTFSVPPRCEMWRVFLSLHKTFDKEYGTS